MDDGSSRVDATRSKQAPHRARIPPLAAIVAFAWAATSLSGASPPPSPANASEYQIKAAFVYNFAKFVEWPGDTASSGGPALIIGVLGDDPFGQTLSDTVRGKTVNGRGLVVKRFPSLRELEPCQVLFLGSSVADHIPEILSRIQGTAVLTVGEGEQFALAGGMVGFMTEDNKVRFAINAQSAERAGLKISSKLLALARIVHGRDEGTH